MEQRLIDANALKSKAYKGGDWEHQLVVDWSDIKEADTVEAAPVVSGEWEKEINFYFCSECEFAIHEDFISGVNYCPSCGARMDGEREKNKMIDCSITENYFKEQLRMTRKCDISCDTCILSNPKTKTYAGCTVFQAEHPQQAIAIVQKWSDEHPQRTYLSDFLEKYPMAPREKNGTPTMCPYMLR